jgi:hypothetical protein
LYSIIIINSVASLVRFTTSTRTWDTVGSYGNLAFFTSATPAFAATYADRDGFIYATEATTGQGWKFNVDLPLTSKLISRGSTYLPGLGDGARCSSNTGVIANPPSCSRLGYLVQRNVSDVNRAATLYSVDLRTSATTPIAILGDGGTEVNGIGYNPFDYYLYGFTAASFVVRISDTGRLIRIPSNSVGFWLIGDIDPNGYMWNAEVPNINTGTSDWQQIDLNPSRPATFGQVIAAGTIRNGTSSQGCFYRFADWAYVPNGGRYLYTAGFAADRVTAYLLRWSMDTHNCETLGQIPDLVLPVASEWGAAYSATDGFLYASENAGGRIYKIQITSPFTATLMAQGPASPSNDGARCVLNTEGI